VTGMILLFVLDVRGRSIQRRGQDALDCAGIVPGVWRRAWDSNPRGRFRALAVFKTAAIGH
jgi:hypothetical protein